MEKLRKCQGCFELKNAKDMIKITKLQDGTLKINPNSSEVGRSSYICKNPDCIKIFLKKKRLKTSLKHSNAQEILKIEEILANYIK